jgi:hypothetical protein
MADGKEFEAPEAGDGVNLDDARPGMLAMASGAMLAVSGLTVAVGGIQLLTVIDIYTWWAKPIPWILLLLGGASLLVGGMVTRARLWASAVGTLLAAGMALVGLVWVVWAFSNGFLSPLTVIGFLMSVVAVLTTPVSIPLAMKAERARRALYS